MATLAAIQKQIATLERQAEAIRKSEAKVAAATVRQLIAQHQLSIEEIGLAGRAAKQVSAKAGGSLKRKPAAAKPAGVPKYRDPKSGKTWTGTGKPPKWIASAKSRDKFLIAASTATATSTATVAPTGAAAPAQRAVRKPASKPVATPTASLAVTDSKAS